MGCLNTENQKSPGEKKVKYQHAEAVATNGVLARKAKGGWPMKRAAMIPPGKV